MNFTTEFHRPTQLENPFPKYKELLTKLHKEIGNEQLSSRIETISLQWATESGYYLKVIDNRFIFVHVTLNPKDFN